MTCPPTMPVTVTDYIEVKPEQVDEAQLQKPEPPILIEGDDGNDAGTNTRNLISHDREDEAFIDGLIKIIRCRVNLECDHE